MSSVLRSIAQKKEGLTKILSVISPSYYENPLDFDVLFPFTYSNGVLDITFEGNTFEQEMITNTGTAPNENPDTNIRILSGARLVTAIGENFKAYIRALRDGSIDVGSPINVYQPCQVLRVQQVDHEHIQDSSVYEFTNIPPTGDNYIPSSSYGKSTYIFKTPLTITVVEGGIQRYITLNSVVSED